MAKWARMDGNRVVETFDHPENPAALFDPSWTWIACPAETMQGSTKSGNTWTHPAPVVAAPVEPPAPAKRTVLSPIEFFGMFSPIEEFGIREAANGDSTEAKILAIFLRRLDHPSLTTIDLASQQVQGGLGLIVAMGKLTPQRKAEIDQGI